MTKQMTFGLMVFAVLCCGPAAAQQPATLSERFLEPSPQVATKPATKPQIARRQPRAADVPSTSQSVEPPANDPVALEDEALQRKISGICRGC